MAGEVIAVARGLVGRVGGAGQPAERVVAVGGRAGAVGHAGALVVGVVGEADVAGVAARVGDRGEPVGVVEAERGGLPGLVGEAGAVAGGVVGERLLARERVGGRGQAP